VPDGKLVPAGKMNVNVGYVGNVRAADVVTETYASGVNATPIDAGRRLVELTAGTPVGFVDESVALAVPLPLVVAGTSNVPLRPEPSAPKVWAGGAVAPAVSDNVDVEPPGLDVGFDVGLDVGLGTGEEPPPPPPQAVRKNESATIAAVAGASLMPVMEVHRSEDRLFAVRGRPCVRWRGIGLLRERGQGYSGSRDAHKRGKDPDDSHSGVSFAPDT
jgi:hypothetical protein